MSPKSPIRGIATVHIHPRPDTPLIGRVPYQTDPSGVLLARAVQTPGKITTSTDLDAITAAPPITIRQSTSTAPTHPVAQEQSLEQYRISAPVSLPDPDAEGFRTFKGRRYVDVQDGGIVQIVLDAQTGLYQARLPSERHASGPMLVRDPDSRFWHALKAPAPTTFPLSTQRLLAFASDLDLHGAEPGHDGLHHYNGKLYVVVGQRTYQALHDLDASSPSRAVMRIVRSEDPVAADSANVYIGTRPGRSEPIVFDEHQGWVGTLAGGAGGMRRSAKPTEAARVADLVFELQALDLEFDQAMAKGEQIQNRWRALKGTDGERNVLEQLEGHHQRELSILEKALSVHTGQKERIIAARGSTSYRNKVIMLQKGRMLTLNQMMIANDSLKLLDGPLFGGPVSDHPKIAAHLSAKLVILKQRQAIADELRNTWRLSQTELKDVAFEPMDLHDTVAFWVYAQSRMFVDTTAEVDINNAHARYLGFCFGEITFAFRAYDSIPTQARIALLSDLLDQTSAIRVSYENLQLPTGAHHSRSREDIVEAIRTFEGTLEEHLNRFHHEQEKTSALPPHEQPIDFDFIPAQDRNQPSVTGLFDQPLLTRIDLSNNQITTIPDFVTAPPPERLAHSVQVNSGTLVSNNPLSDAMPQQLLAYRERLMLAGTPLTRTANLITTSVNVARRPVTRDALEPDPRWIAGLSVDQATARKAQWRALREQDGSDGFFNILASRGDHADFRRQAWDVIDVITENNPQSRNLRRELFDRACEAGCTDLAAATFTDLQVLAMTYKARVQARLDLDGAPLVALSKGLFRLKHVDDFAAAEIASSRAIINDPATSRELRNSHSLRIRDPHEMTMAYRFGLRDRLQLPFQPQALTFIGMAGVTPAMLDAAYRKVSMLNGSPEEFQALVSMDFWQDFIIHKYRAQFDASRQPFQDRQGILDSQSSQGLLSEAQYNSQTDDVTAQLAIVEATLIQTLTRQELQPRTTIEATSANVTSAQETPGASNATL